MHSFERIREQRTLLKHAVSERDAGRAGQPAKPNTLPEGKDKGARFAPQAPTSVKALKAQRAQRAAAEARARDQRAAAEAAIARDRAAQRKAAQEVADAIAAQRVVARAAAFERARDQEWFEYTDKRVSKR